MWCHCNGSTGNFSFDDIQIYRYSSTCIIIRTLSSAVFESIENPLTICLVLI